MAYFQMILLRSNYRK